MNNFMRNIIIILIALLIVCVGTWFFLGDGLEEEVPEEENDEKELAEILAQAEEIDSLTYEVTMETEERTIMAIFMQEGSNIRVQGVIEEIAEGEEVVILMDKEENSYIAYLPEQEAATQVGLGEVEKLKKGSIKDQVADLLDLDPIVTGTEVINGKDCFVVEYGHSDMRLSMWIWEDHGLPIAMEAEKNGEVMLIEVSNIEFEDVSDEEFQLPPHIEMNDIPAF